MWDKSRTQNKPSLALQVSQFIEPPNSIDFLTAHHPILVIYTAVTIPCIDYGMIVNF